MSADYNIPQYIITKQQRTKSLNVFESLVVFLSQLFHIITRRRAIWCFTSTNERGETDGAGGAAAPTDELQLVEWNSDRYIVWPTLAGNVVFVVNYDHCSTSETGAWQTR